MMRQLDWEDAAKICEEYKGCRIYAGLLEDLPYTEWEIFDGEKHVDNYVYVSSHWATPVLIIKRDDGNLIIPCWEKGEDSDMPDWWMEGAE